MRKFKSFTPLMHEWEYKLIEKYLNPSDIFLEWGAGSSTLYFSDFVSKVISIEHDVDYYNEIKKCIEAFNGQNIELYHVPPTIRDQKIKRYDQLKDYIEYPVKQNLKFNKILIDGRARKECAIFISEYIDENAIVFIHDFNHNKIEGYEDKDYHNDILTKYDILEFERRGQGIVALKKKKSQLKIFKTRQDLLKSFGENLTVCEIGVFQGEFSKFIWGETNPKELVLIDLFNWKTSSGDQNGENTKFADLNEEYLQLQNHFKDQNVKIIKGDSSQVLKSFDDKYFDIIYVDGDHSYKGALKDLQTAFHKIKTNGIICGHDYNIKLYPEVVAATTDFCNQYNLQINFLTQDKLPTFGIIKI